MFQRSKDYLYLKNNKKPVRNKINKVETTYATWIATQKNNLKTNKESMSFPDRRSKFLELSAKYNL